MYRGLPPLTLTPTATTFATAVKAMAVRQRSWLPCLTCSMPLSHKWEWRLQPGTFATPTGAAVLPGGEVVTLTPSGGDGSKLASNLRAATHTIVNASGEPTFAVSVVHMAGDAQNSCIRVLDVDGHELAAARLIDATTVPRLGAPKLVSKSCRTKETAERTKFGLAPEASLTKPYWLKEG